MTSYLTNKLKFGIHQFIAIKYYQQFSFYFYFIAIIIKKKSNITDIRSTDGTSNHPSNKTTVRETGSRNVYAKEYNTNYATHEFKLDFRMPVKDVLNRISSHFEVTLKLT